MTYRDVRVKLIDHNDPDLGFNLWVESRQGVVPKEEIESPEYVDKVRRMNLQYMNFPHFTFEIVGSILFRNFLYTINKVAQWAESQRFGFAGVEGFDESNYVVSEEYRGDSRYEAQWHEFMKAVQINLDPDVNRVEMPYSLSSRYWIQLDYKSLVALLGVMKYKFPFFYENYGTKMMTTVKEVAGVELESYIPKFIDTSMDQYFYHQLIDLDTFEEGLTIIDDVVILKVKLGMVMYSQFLRQMDSNIKGLWDVIRSGDMMYGNTIIPATLVTNKERFFRTISNRSCWFSMSGGGNVENSWSKVIDLALPKLSLNDFKALLPCKSNPSQCKFREDIKIREDYKPSKENHGSSRLVCGLFHNSLDICNQRAKEDGTRISQLYIDVVKSRGNK